MTRKEKSSAIWFNKDPILHSAWLYYQEGLNQTDIAEVLGVSRASVVKYLQQARELGYVQITLDQDRYTQATISSKLKTKFGLDNVLVAPAGDGQTHVRIRLARAGAMYLSHVTKDNDTIGIAWGRTIHELSQAMPRKPLKNVSVLQMIGSMYAQYSFAADEGSSLIANRFEGTGMNLNVPAIVSSARLATELQAEPIVRSHFAVLERCSRAVFVVGHCSPNNSAVRAGIISEQDMETYKQLGATAVICGRFLDAQGQPVITELDQRILGINLAQLRQIPSRIMIGGGPKNHQAVLAGLRGGYVTDLITDHETADFLLENG
ncbi:MULTISPECIES: sugar-binding transcriptional regulator [Pseudovibrio]|uniref:sugar-binding transcriptional regulator n=1 Tax=Stappiaceae TaxID=2821832 RepID=UPI0023669C66|nr:MULTISPECIES: sugar-binding transcriptional regulator [Pseudovibrio]MDD7910567.1 sugar-binding transcriptional regulator [Pseudovibrio exalbescens]MDX5594584.1 sugar-binding transcriptional regulator [Pseudovibrio sp. SPO723]